MRLIIQPDYQSVSKWAAHYVAAKIKAAHPTPDKPFVLGCPTGSSPLGMYKELIDLNKKGIVSFQNVVTFNMDEYVGSVSYTHLDVYKRQQQREDLSKQWADFILFEQKKPVLLLGGEAGTGLRGSGWSAAGKNRPAANRPTTTDSGKRWTCFCASAGHRKGAEQ